MNKNIKLIEVRSEIAAGTRGASLGIGAMKVASLDVHSNFFQKYPIERVEDMDDILFNNTAYVHAKHIDGVLVMLERVCDATEKVIKEGHFPFVLAGDHSTAAGTLSGIKKCYPDKRLGVIWIDAHADLHSPFTTPSGNMHGMPLAMVTGIDNEEQKINDPMHTTLEYWEKIKNVGVQGPKLDPSDIVFITVRDTEGPENEIIKKHKIKNFSTSEVEKKGGSTIAKEALEHLKDCDLIYVSFDVDSLDTSISTGTGTPVADGLLVEEAKDINECLIADPKVCCWEIVEVNPTLDKLNVMAKNAFLIMSSTAESYHKRKQIS